MAAILFKLRDVPEDEAEEVRLLLAEHGFAFYETSAGALGVGTAAIWLYDETELERAKALLDKYQAERFERMQQDSSQPHETLMDRLLANPVQFVLFLGLILFMLYVSLAPFLEFGK